MVDLSRWASYGYDQRLEVFGPKGMLQVANDRPNCSVHTTNQGISKYFFNNKKFSCFFFKSKSLVLFSEFPCIGLFLQDIHRDMSTN